MCAIYSESRGFKDYKYDIGLAFCDDKDKEKDTNFAHQKFSLQIFHQKLSTKHFLQFTLSCYSDDQR